MSGSVADCAFCQIIRGETPAYLILKDELSLAFLDRRPLFPGHCLLVPKVHYPTLPDLPAELIGPLFGQAQRLAKAMEQGLAAEGTFVAMNNRVSQSVPHLHIHVVPRRKKDGLKGFFCARQLYESEAAMREVQQRLRATLDAAQSSEGGKG